MNTRENDKEEIKSEHVFFAWAANVFRNEMRKLRRFVEENAVEATRNAKTIAECIAKFREVTNYVVESTYTRAPEERFKRAMEDSNNEYFNVEYSEAASADDNAQKFGKLVEFNKNNEAFLWSRYLVFVHFLLVDYAQREFDSAQLFDLKAQTQ